VNPSTAPIRITAANVVASIALAVPLTHVALEYGSKLALAQAADSVTDSLTAAAFLFSLRVGARPADADHPRGHHRAEPIAALVAAVLAGVLAVEVFREALAALLSDARPVMAWPLATVIAVKAVFKSGFMVLARSHYQRNGSPALHALEIDARNDSLVGILALVGFFAARYGSPGWDAWLAMPLALWIGAAGVGLAQENIRFLMGEAPPQRRQDALAEIARTVAGVQSTHELTARYDGTQIDVSLHIVVDETLTVRQAHDIAEAVEARLMQEDDVLVAIVHVDVDPPPR
jgi:cation diffusion facilitator family transporter